MTTRRILPALILLTACGGARAGATAQTSADGADRLHVYEVAPEQMAAARESGVIQVTGTGSVSAEPDRAHVALTVETRRSSAAEAATANAEQMDGLLAAIRAGDFPGLEIETYGYSLRPEYTRSNNEAPRVSGYVAANNVRVTTSDVSAAGPLLDVGIANGANRVSGLSFGVSNVESYRAEALRRAVTNARQKAEAIAGALNLTLGPVLEVSDGTRAPAPAMERLSAVSVATPTPIEPGEQTITASVTIRFALGGGRPLR